MSTTLGEKLRQAREARGISISEVAEQTRISALYIKSIEEDDYRTLPGGIFNKGFVKSYARQVGIDEQEALQDYGALVGSQNMPKSDEIKTYHPEVLTDDQSSKSNLPTVIFAVVILGLMTFGILALLNYLQNKPSGDIAVGNTNISVNTNTELSNPAATVNANISTETAPSMNNLKVEVKAVNAPVSLTSTSDGTRASNLMSPGRPLDFEPKESLKIGYSKSLAQNVQITLNGKQISLPTTPASGRNIIEFEINKNNVASIWQTGKISFDAPANATR